MPSELSAQTSGEPVILRLIERDTSDHDLLPHQFFFLGEDEMFSDDDEDQNFSDFDGGDDDDNDDNDDGVNHPAAGWAYDWESNYFWNGDIPEWVLEDLVGEPPSPPELPAGSVSGSGSGSGGAANAAANAHHMRWVDGPSEAAAAAAAAAANADHIRWDYDGDPSEAAAAASNWETAAASGPSTENPSFAEWDEVLARELANAPDAPTPSAEGESTTTASPHDDSNSWDVPPQQPSRARAHQATNSASASSATTGGQQASSTWALGARGGLAPAEPTLDQWDANCSSATTPKAAARSDSHSSSLKVLHIRSDDIDDGDDDGNDDGGDDDEDDVYDDQEDDGDMDA